MRERKLTKPGREILTRLAADTTLVLLRADKQWNYWLHGRGSSFPGWTPTATCMDLLRAGWIEPINAPADTLLYDITAAGRAKLAEGSK